jgi:ribosomal protein S18 acetylase RimI-like enzyme
MALDIRHATPEEYAAIADLCVAAYAPFMVGDNHYVGTLRDVARRAAAAELLVAADGGVLGTVTFVPDGGPLGEIAGPHEAEFRMLAVDPAAQGRGVGTALLERVLADSRARGHEAVVCSSLPQMRAAHRIYERLGFQRAPDRDWSPVSGVHLIAFTVTLEAPPTI